MKLNQLIIELKNRNLRIGSWYGTFDLTEKHHLRFEHINRGYGYHGLESGDDATYPWFLYWEIVWVVINNSFKPGDKLLDLGR
jgi:hypothetical protein